MKIVDEFNAIEMELIRRGIVPLDLNTISFPKQIAFVEDESRFVDALCTRRAGKSNGIAMKLYNKAKKHKRALLPYFALTRDSAKNTMWNILLETAERMRIKVEASESKLEVKLVENDTIIKLFGADMKNFIARIRGIKTPLAAVDEAGEFGTHLEKLIDDILTPAIGDYEDGQICLTGTPGRVPVGYFYDVTGLGKFGYSHHHWSLFDNPYFPNPVRFVDEIVKKKGWLPDNPTYLREYCGKWVKDIDALVFKYDHNVNHYADSDLKKGKWNYIMGVDVGFRDADAISIVGWHENERTTYLIQEEIGRGRDITDLATSIDRLNKQYNPIKIVMDTGGLGLKIAEEIRRRFSLPVVAAEKNRKFEYIELLNDALRGKRFFAKSTSTFANDCALIEWDEERSTPDRKVVSDKFHSDITDSVLYAYRESLSFLSEDAVNKTIPYSEDWFKEEEERIINGILEKNMEEKRYQQMMFGDD
jgi:hypothetical protein